MPTSQRHKRAPAFVVPDPSLLEGKNILVFDDGLRPRAVPHRLRAAGATSVAGVVLARQPY